MTTDFRERFKAIMQGVATRETLKKSTDEKKTALRAELSAVKRNLALRARFLSVTEKANLLEDIDLTEAHFSRLADEENWLTREILIQGQYQICTCCGHTAEATVGIFARQQHKFVAYAWRLRETRDIPDNFEIKRQWATAHLARCVSCATLDTIDDTLARFNTISPRNSDQLTLWS